MNKQIKKSLWSILFDSVNVIITGLLGLTCLYPIVYILFASFSNGNLLMSHTGLLLKPLGFTLDTYKMVFKDPMIFKGYANTLFVVIVGTALNIIMTLLGAYFLSRRDVYFQKAVMIFIMITMFFNGGMIPTYLTVTGLGLDNSLWALIIPVAISTFNMIIMRTGMESIPVSLEESVKLDGGGHLTVLFAIVVPLSLPTIAVLILYYAVGHWNSWFNAMLYIKDRSKYPLQLVLRGILLSNDTTAMTASTTAVDTASIGDTIKYGVIVVATLPILCVYPFLQKYFAKGIMVGAVKG